jgi:hypothetical protein
VFRGTLAATGCIRPASTRSRSVPTSWDSTIERPPSNDLRSVVCVGAWPEHDRHWIDVYIGATLAAA